MGEEAADFAFKVLVTQNHKTLSNYTASKEFTTKNLRPIGDQRAHLFDHHLTQYGPEKQHFDFMANVILRNLYPEIPNDIAEHLYAGYGMRSVFILEDLIKDPSKAETVGGYYTRAEIEFLYKFEFCESALDILERRTRLAFIDSFDSKG